jgi:hypothetical protein
MVFEKSIISIQSILWIFYIIYLSVFSLAGQYFVYSSLICCYFFVAREVQMREVLLVICDDQRAWGLLNAALNGAAHSVDPFIW